MRKKLLKYVKYRSENETAKFGKIDFVFNKECVLTRRMS